MSAAYLLAVAARRSYRIVKKESPIEDSKIQDIVHKAIYHAPSAFNSQSNRAIVLLKDEHDKLWDLIKTTVLPVTPAEKHAFTETKLNAFKAGYGTILFFVSRSAITELQTKFPPYAAKAQTWANHSDGMVQHITWTALEAEGLGASLQHYNPVIDKVIQETWNVPEDWELSAQMVIGTPAAEAGPKTFSDEERVKVYGA